MNIYLYIPSRIRRIRVLFEIWRVQRENEKSKKYRVLIRKNLENVNQYASIPNHKNIYFITIDLSDETQVIELRKIRKMDPFSVITVFVRHTQYVNRLYEYGISAHSYVEISDTSSYYETIRLAIKRGVS